MRRSITAYVAAALVACGAAALGGAGCSGSDGQLMFVFQTDMALPKDIDSVRILVTREGAVIYDKNFERLGSEEGIRLPATLGFLTPDDPSTPIKLRVTATQGGEDKVRVLREVTTTVPTDRTAMLQVPLQLLCFGSGEAERDENGVVKRDERGDVIVKSSCGDGKTCVAGACKAAEVPSDTLPDFFLPAVFGGGTGAGDGRCFDTVKCLETGASVALDLAAFAADTAANIPPEEIRCLAPAPGGTGALNVAFLTQGGGICGDSRCFVPLDAESDSGWQTVEGGQIRLPNAVCEKVLAGTLLGLVAASVGEGTCAQKDVRLPTCGAWSASGAGSFTAPDKAQPLPLALGLRSPVALAVGSSGVYWTEESSFGSDGAPGNDGAVKWVPLGGGEPQILTGGLRAPRDLVVQLGDKPVQDEPADAVRVPDLVFWTTAGTGANDGALLVGAPELGAKRNSADPLAEPTPLLAGRQQPEGIALRNGELFWTELFGGQVFQVATTGAGLEVAAQEGTTLPLPAPEGGDGSLGLKPYRVAAAENVVCWIYQGELTKNTGAVACQPQDGSASAWIARDQGTPRAIALDVDPGSGNARAVYWTSFEGGAVFRANLLDDGHMTADPPTAFASDQGVPNGLAVDETSVYWTNYGDGTVMQAPKGNGAAAVVLARGQRRPGAIQVTAEAVYWLAGGSLTPENGTPDGAVMRLLKK